MPLLIFLTSGGHRRIADVAGGDTLLRAAMQHGLHDLHGICGGACCCASCHVYLEPGPGARVMPAEAMERDLLELAEAPLRPGSRLACQVLLDDTMTEWRVEIPSPRLWPSHDDSTTTQKETP